MKKISKKIILIKNLKKIDSIFISNFYLVSANNLIDINKELNFSVFKKGLYRYILPGQFLNPIKNYFKKHTYINYNLNKTLMLNLINNKEIIVYKYNNFVFLNNLSVLRNSTINKNFEFFTYPCTFRKFFLICLLFYAC